MTPAELLADYARARANLRRLNQVAAVSFRRWEEHHERCRAYQCRVCLRLLTQAEAYRMAAMTISGAAVWR